MIREESGIASNRLDHARGIVSSRGDEFLPCLHDSRAAPYSHQVVFRSVTVIASVSACLGSLAYGADAIDAPPCRAILDAIAKSRQVPVHAFSMIGAISAGTAPRQFETITVHDLGYTKVGSTWKVEKVRPLISMFKEQARLHRGEIQCGYERDEIFEGEKAGVYKIRIGPEASSVALELWVSKSSGLMLRSAMDITVKGKVIHTATRYDYKDVKPPL